MNFLPDTELTPEQRVTNTVRAARDSVWVVNDELAKYAANNNVLTDEMKGNIERNVAHLELVVANPDVVSLGGDITDLTDAITAGRAVLPQSN